MSEQPAVVSLGMMSSSVLGSCPPRFDFWLRRIWSKLDVVLVE
jgi:hypothetical protein